MAAGRTEGRTDRAAFPYPYQIDSGWRNGSLAALWGRGPRGKIDSPTTTHCLPGGQRRSNSLPPSTRNVTTARFVNLDLGFLVSLGFRARDRRLGSKEGEEARRRRRGDTLSYCHCQRRRRGSSFLPHFAWIEKGLSGDCVELP